MPIMTTTKDGIPEYSGKYFSNKKNDFCIFVFVLNEGVKFHNQINEMSKYASIVDIVIADGGSTDNTINNEALKSCGVTTVLTKISEGGLSAQMRMAFHYAIENKYHGVIVVDGNGKDDMSAIPNFVDALKGGGDHIQGSRFIPGGEAINTPVTRHLGLKFLHAPLIRLASGFPYTDTTNGFRAYSSKFLTHDKTDLFRDVFNKYELHYYLAIKAPELGMNVTEIPVVRAYPKTGKTPTKISFIKGNLLILTTLLKAVLRRYG